MDNNRPSARPPARRPVELDWLEDDLERLGHCPVCGATARQLVFSGLKDKIFFCAPGSWSNWRCYSCDVVYLDPRPTLQSIGRAYEAYYTHELPPKSVVSRISAALRTRIRNSYLNKQLGYQLKNTLPLGWMAYMFFASQAAVTENTVRHLPSPAKGACKLLDIGCGNGEFLKIAQDIGYDVQGVEFDPAACAAAAGFGLKVFQGSLEEAILPQNYFDQITLSHVLEHFHNPRSALAKIFTLLRPGGRVWITVPNISGYSIQKFSENSRLLEPPRHLVMFDTKSLASILAAAGYQNIICKNTKDFNYQYFTVNQSWMIENGLDPYATDTPAAPAHVKQEFLAAYQSSINEIEHDEIITFTAHKPVSC